MKHKVDKNEAPAGFCALKAPIQADGSPTCRNCAFNSVQCLRGRTTAIGSPSCIGQYRRDKTNVIFKKEGQ